MIIKLCHIQDPSDSALTAVAVDRRMKAPLTKGVQKWAKPNRLDLGGFDGPGAQDHVKARIKILADLKACCIKRACGTPESILGRHETSGKYKKMDIIAALEAPVQAGYF